MDKTHEIVKLAKQKTEVKVEFVTSVIEDMEKHQKKISFYSVAKEAGVSKSFLYSNDTLRAKIIAIRDNKEKGALSQDNAQTLVAALRKEIERLQKELKEYQTDRLWKAKYEDLKQENKLLKKRIEILAGKQY